jgi:hypothetical protein
VPGGAEDAAEEDRHEVAACHHEYGRPDLAHEEPDDDREEGAVHALGHAGFDGEAKVLFCADAGLLGYGDGAEEV